MTNQPVSWEEIELFAIKNKDSLHSLLTDKEVSVELFIAYVNFHIRTDRILMEFTDQIIPRQFVELVRLVMAGVREEKRIAVEGLL